MVQTLRDKKDRISAKYMWLIIQVMSVLFFFLITGCGQIEEEQKINRYQLEADIHLSLPGDVVLLNSGDDGGRVPGYFEWLMYTPSSFTLPKEWIPNSTEIATRVIESRKPKQKIQQPTNAFAINWETHYFEFNGTLLQTEDGEFLLVKRFRRQPTPLP